MRYFVCGLAGYTMISWTVNIVTYTLYTTVWHWWTNYIIISVTIVSFGPKKSYGQIYFLLPESSLFICKCKYFMFYAFLHSIWTYFENSIPRAPVVWPKHKTPKLINNEFNLISKIQFYLSLVKFFFFFFIRFQIEMYEST